MAIELHWVASQSAACCYAANLRRLGRLGDDSPLAAALAEPADLLIREIRTLGLPEPQIWHQLLPLSAQVANNRQLAEVVLQKTVGRNARADAAVAPLAGRIGDLERAAMAATPDLVDQIEAQSQFLRSGSKTAGDGLLQTVGRLTDDRLLVSRAEIAMVPPLAGGGGLEHLPYNSVSIEAVAADPAGGLPEAARLVWLISQLNIDLPMFSENIAPLRRPLLAGLALLPAVLTAAAERGLIEGEASQHLGAAAQAWGAGECGTAAPIDAVRNWWTTYVASRPPWPVALAALDRMV